MSSHRVNAPDGLPWPTPIVAVSQEEQRPWTFGWHAYADRATDRSRVASDVPDPSSVIVRKYGAPFHLMSANLPTADYWLVGPDGPRDGFVGIERKERDLAVSLTTEHARFDAELDRLRIFTNPLIVTSCSTEALLERHPQHEASFVGSLAVIAARYRIPVLFMPSREMAERAAARFLIECWQAWLTADPLVLSWAREEERRRGVVREHRRAQRKAPKMREEQTDVANRPARP